MNGYAPAFYSGYPQPGFGSSYVQQNTLPYSTSLRGIPHQYGSSYSAAPAYLPAGVPVMVGSSFPVAASATTVVRSGAGTTTVTTSTAPAVATVPVQVPGTAIHEIPTGQLRDVRGSRFVFSSQVARIKADTKRDELEKLDNAILNIAARGRGCLHFSYDIEGEYMIQTSLWADRYSFLDFLHYMSKEPQKLLATRLSWLDLNDMEVHTYGINRNDPGIPEGLKALVNENNSTFSRANLGFTRLYN